MVQPKRWAEDALSIANLSGQQARLEMLLAGNKLPPSETPKATRMLATVVGFEGEQEEEFELAKVVDVCKLQDGQAWY